MKLNDKCIFCNKLFKKHHHLQLICSDNCRKLLAQQKKARKYQDNKEQMKKKRLEYVKNNKEKCIKADAQYYKKNRLKILIQKKEYYNRPEIKTRRAKTDKIYRLNNIKIINKRIEKNKPITNKYNRERYKIDKNFKIKKILRSRLYCAIKGNFKTLHTIEYLGCTIPEFIIYFEKLFKPGMSWDKLGVDGIHIDHIKPCAAFDLSKKSEQKKCFNYKNLQPLWAIDNLKKGDKYAT